MSNQPQKLHVDLSGLERAIREFADLPKNIVMNNAMDMDCFLEYVDLVLNANVFPEEVQLYPDQVEAPDTTVLAKLKEKGFEIADDGIIEKFQHQVLDIRLLQFFARLSRGMFYLNKYIALIGLENVKRGVFNRKDANLNKEVASDVIRFGILYLEFFFRLMEFAYTNFQFSRDGNLITGGRAIGRITGHVFGGVDSVLGKWYGAGMTNFAQFVRTSIDATFSAWLLLRRQYGVNFDIRPANNEEDLKGIDFVVTAKDGRIVKYVQCKAKKEDDQRSTAYVNFGGKGKIALELLFHYIDNEARYDSERAELMKTSATNLAKLAEAQGVEWEWLFVASNYYVNIDY